MHCYEGFSFIYGVMLYNLFSLKNLNELYESLGHCRALTLQLLFLFLKPLEYLKQDLQFARFLSFRQ